MSRAIKQVAQRILTVFILAFCLLNLTDPLCADDSISDESISGWWRVESEDGRSSFLRLLRGSVFEAKSARGKALKIGQYESSLNENGQRILQINQQKEGLFMQGAGTTLTVLIERRGDFPLVLALLNGSSVGYDGTVISFSGSQFFFGGVVRDIRNKAPLKGVTVQLKEECGDTTVFDVETPGRKKFEGEADILKEGRLPAISQVFEKLEETDISFHEDPNLWPEKGDVIKITNDGTHQDPKHFGNYKVEYNGEIVDTIENHDKVKEGKLALFRKALRSFLSG